MVRIVLSVILNVLKDVLKSVLLMYLIISHIPMLEYSEVNDRWMGFLIFFVGVVFIVSFSVTIM